ncbi:AcrR family transcriptional regulator [Oxalobacteraceae bacterium GrIS 1.18]
MTTATRAPTKAPEAPGSPKIPRLERGKARVVALKLAGAQVFAERGYDAATMTEIATRASASIGSLYQFFPTKELLARAIHDELLDAMTVMLEELGKEVGSRTGSKLIDLLFARLSEFLEQHPAFSTLAQRGEVDPERKLATRVGMRQQIGLLLSRTTTPLTPERSESVAILILELMKMVVGLGKTDGPKVRNAVLDELRTMLFRHLEIG